MNPKDRGPDNVLNTMKTAAVALHELYLSYKAAGFSESQAFALILAQVSSMARPSKEE